MDLPSLNSILRVNGLTKTSAPENIADVLLRSGYKEEEIPQAIAVIQGAPAPSVQFVPKAYVQPIIENTRTTSRSEEGNASIFAGRLGVLQFWFGMLLAIFLYGIVFILVEVSTIPLFSIMTGISLFSPPDLSTAPIRVILVFGIGMAMLILPALFFIAVTAGLQVRRCHDYGLSATSWFMAISALTVSAYLLWHLTPLAMVAIVPTFVLWAVLLSWPGTKDGNAHGDPFMYASIWAALDGNYNDIGCLTSFVKRFIAPLAYLQISGIVMIIFIHTILPRVPIPAMRELNATASSSVKNIQI